MKTVKILGFLLVSIFMTGSLFAQNIPQDDVVLKRVGKAEFKEALQSGEYILFDVRTTDEYMEGHIKGAKSLDISDENFERTLDNLNKEQKYLIYCQSGGRSKMALEKMKEKGFKRVLELQGGYSNWTE